MYVIALAKCSTPSACLDAHDGLAIPVTEHPWDLNRGRAGGDPSERRVLALQLREGLSFRRDLEHEGVTTLIRDAKIAISLTGELGDVARQPEMLPGNARGVGEGERGAMDRSVEHGEI